MHVLFQSIICNSELKTNIIDNSEILSNLFFTTAQESSQINSSSLLFNCNINTLWFHNDYVDIITNISILNMIKGIPSIPLLYIKLNLILNKLSLYLGCERKYIFDTLNKINAEHILYILNKDIIDYTSCESFIPDIGLELYTPEIKVFEFPMKIIGNLSISPSNQNRLSGIFSLNHIYLDILISKIYNILYIYTNCYDIIQLRHIWYILPKNKSDSKTENQSSYNLDIRFNIMSIIIFAIKSFYNIKNIIFILNKIHFGIIMNFGHISKKIYDIYIFLNLNGIFIISNISINMKILITTNNWNIYIYLSHKQSYGQLKTSINNIYKEIVPIDNKNIQNNATLSQNTNITETPNNVSI